ncbi:stage II sporulation protein M [Bacillus thermotolerans]|uniref:stage II sporulation protein M n=1 Tax=Bacillus thermotolerans TaxID=1221996 RepID=UPI00058913FF|nr:stage II sporulation protein M [Bacillus thermotolerans]KKB36432.1 Stage II sporulation protein M (SpoIIM) [Bacillus thermotolerans]
MQKRLSQVAISKHIQAHASIYVFVAVLFFMGVVFGAIVVNSLSLVQKEDLAYYLQQFFGQVSSGQIADSEDLFQQSFIHNVKYLGCMWLFGISIIGLPLIFIFLFMKGIVVGFSVGFLVQQMNWDGFFVAVASILPQNLIIVPAFIFVASVSTAFSLQLMKKVFMKQSSHFQMSALLSKYFLFFLAAVGMAALAAGIEAYISPVLMQIVIK